MLEKVSTDAAVSTAGGGRRLFDDGLPAGSWSLTDMSTTDSGAICLLYDRK